MLDLILSARFWLIISLFVFVIYMIAGGIKYINCIDAIKGYFDIFRNTKGKLVKKNFSFFCVFPILVSLCSNLYKSVTLEVLNVICVIISILTAMLYSFMAIINTKYESAAQSEETSYNTYTWIKNVHKETIDVITCEILISVLLLLMCFVQPVLQTCEIVFWRYNQTYLSVQSIFSFLVYYCFYFFILNLLIVTKRFYRITQQDTTK